MDRCGEINQANQKALAPLVGAKSTVSAAELGARLHHALRCVETPRGAWALTVAGITVSSDGIFGRWSITYVDETGWRVSMSPDATFGFGEGGEPVARGQNLEWSQEARVVPNAPAIFDYDGDGIVEATVIVSTDWNQESGNSLRIEQGRIWTVRNRQIVLYEPGYNLRVEEVADIDGDGRPDVITHEPYAGTASIMCGSEDPYLVYGPRLLAHSRTDGSFSRDDATAVSFASRECSELPHRILIYEDSRPEMVDLPRSAWNIACARLRGATQGNLLSEIAAACHPINACQTCDDKKMLEKWATLNPPLRIR